MPFFKMPYTSSSFVELLLCAPIRDCAVCISPFPNKTVKRTTVLKMEREKGQQNHPVTVKGFQRSYVRNSRAGAFHRGKMPSFALVVLAPGPAETRGTRSSELCLPVLRAAPSMHAKPLMQAVMHSASLPNTRQEKKTQTNSNKKTPYPSHLTAPTTFLLFPILRNVLPWLRPCILKSI